MRKLIELNPQFRPTIFLVFWSMLTFEFLAKNRLEIRWNRTVLRCFLLRNQFRINPNTFKGLSLNLITIISIFLVLDLLWTVMVSPFIIIILNLDECKFRFPYGLLDNNNLLISELFPVWSDGLRITYVTVIVLIYGLGILLFIWSVVTR